MRSSIILVFLFIGFSVQVQAQTGFGIEGGIGMSSLRFAPSTYPILYTSASTGSIASGKLGALVDIPINQHIYFQTGLFGSIRGGERDFSYHTSDSFNESVHQVLTILYGDVPMSVVYKSGIQGKGRFIAGIGATFSYILFGKNKLSDHSVYNDTLTISNSDGNVQDGYTIHAFDLGLNLFAGYEAGNGLFFKGYYTAGVNDIGIGTEIDKTRIWGVSAGYFFGKRRNINKEADDLIDHSTD